jgi:hypothetical protein
LLGQTEPLELGSPPNHQSSKFGIAIHSIRQASGEKRRVEPTLWPVGTKRTSIFMFSDRDPLSSYSRAQMKSKFSSLPFMCALGATFQVRGDAIARSAFSSAIAAAVGTRDNIGQVSP